MPIIFNGETFSNGGTVTLNLGDGDVSLSAILASVDGSDPVQVWKKEQQFSGGSVNWNNINKDNSGYLSNAMDLRGFSTISFYLNGYYAYGAQSGWGRISIRYSDGTLQEIVRWTSNTTFGASHTMSLAGKTNEQLNGARIYADTHIAYEVATGVYNLLQATCGTITAR